jgi:poly(A) polymerase
MDIFAAYPHLRLIQSVAARSRKKIYLVGGFLRDYLLGRPSCDLDFAVSGGALELSRIVADDVRGAWVLLDQERGCARVVKKSPEGMWTYDFADFRDETIDGDLARRDFTVNTLALDLSRLKEGSDCDALIEDRHGARRDLEKKRIRRVSIRSLNDDPLRILRAFALKASLNFRIQLSTLNQIRRDRNRLSEVSMERIRDEFFKILASPVAFETLAEMDKHGVLAEVIPQIRVMADCAQGGYHHLDVWGHSLETARQFEKIFAAEMDPRWRTYLNESLGGGRTRRCLVTLAALLHDIGKPDTRKKENDGYSFHGHEHVGASITKIIVRQLKLSIRERRAVEDMVRFHLRPGYLSNFSRPSEKAWFRYLRDTRQEAVSVALLSLADQRATRGPMTTDSAVARQEAVCREAIARYFESVERAPLHPLITGRDLIESLHLTPSPMFGTILSAVREQQSLGMLADSEEALMLARQLAGMEEKEELDED